MPSNERTGSVSQNSRNPQQYSRDCERRVINRKLYPVGDGRPLLPNNADEIGYPLPHSILGSDTRWDSHQQVGIERSEGGEDRFSMMVPERTKRRTDSSQVDADPGAPQAVAT